MTEKEKNEIINSMYIEVNKLKQKIDELKDFTKPVAPDNAIGRISRMDVINNKSIFDASMRNAQNRLTQLQNILSLKNDESFGMCVKCHQPIPIERLKIRPEIRFCANCLRKYDANRN